MTITTEIFSNSHMPGANEAVADYVAMRIFGKVESFGPSCSLAVFDGEQIIAAVVYHNYHPEEGTIELSTAADDKRWMTRAVLRDIFSAAFQALNVQSCYWKTSADNPSLSLWKRLGAVGHFLPRLFGRDKDGWIFWLTDDAWRASRFA